MTGTISYTPPAPPTRTFAVSGELKLVATHDYPGQRRVGVMVENGGRQFAFPIEGQDYDQLCTRWATDADLLAFVAAKFNLT